MECYLSLCWNCGRSGGERIVYQGGRCKRWRWLGVGKRVAVHVRHAFVLYILNSLSLLSAREQMAQETAQARPFGHLLAHCRQLLPLDAHCNARHRLLGLGNFHFLLVVRSGGNLVEPCKTQETQYP